MLTLQCARATPIQVYSVKLRRQYRYTANDGHRFSSLRRFTKVKIYSVNGEIREIKVRRLCVMCDRKLVKLCRKPPELSSKPAARPWCCRSTGQTDRQTDGRTLDCFKTLTTYYADRFTTKSLIASAAKQ